ncbi:MAG: trypsin-like peptidase domain-containing protein, partial [Thermoleophilaceae bacterium]
MKRAAAACLVGLAALAAGCAQDPASPQAAGPRVVSVLGAGSERATGFAVASGEVVTVAHAIPPDDAVRVQVGPGTPRRARVLRMDVRADLALLAVPRLRGSVVETATTGDGNQVRVVAARGRRVVTMA